MNGSAWTVHMYYEQTQHIFIYLSILDSMPFCDLTKPLLKDVF